MAGSFRVWGPTTGKTPPHSRFQEVPRDRHFAHMSVSQLLPLVAESWFSDLITIHFCKNGHFCFGIHSG